MQQKPITISSNEFNEKIKNNLRDFYIYQFKKFRKDADSDYRKKGTNESKPASTFTEEKQRLISMLESQTQMEWTRQKGGICCCTADTRNLDTNPFWEPYRFCAASPRYIGWLISMVLLLHPQVQLRDPMGIPAPLFPVSLRPFHPDITNRLKAESKEGFPSWLYSHIDGLYDDTEWGVFCTERYLAIYRQRINPKKMILEDDPDRFGMAGNTLQYYYYKSVGNQDILNDQFKNRLAGEITGILHSQRISSRREQWHLSDNRLKISEENPDLAFRFGHMLVFFSQTLPLGFIGSRLQTRTGAQAGIFRYKHSYIEKSLNDYNIADLLHGIQSESWIQLEYRNGTKLRYQQMICLPLQIRESTQDGRQYLMYYHPGYRSLGALRLDFIDKIRFVSVNIRTYYTQDLIHARQALRYIWGCAMPDFFSGNLMQPPRYTHIKLLIRRDLPVIENRLRREARHGQVTRVDEENRTLTYEVELTDPLEIIPWIRSFTPRVLGLWVDGVSCPVQTPDPTVAMRDYLRQPERDGSAKILRHELRNDVDFQICDPGYFPHEQLFHPVFSLTFDTVVQILFFMMQHPDRYYTHSQIMELIRFFWPARIHLQEDIRKNILKNIEILCSCQGNSYRLDYIPAEEFLKQCTNLWDLIPLSDLEASYLKGILLQEKAKLFLSDQEIRQILSGLDPGTQALDFSLVYYYDQYRDITPRYSDSSLQKHFSMLMASASRCETLNVVYAGQRRTTSESLTAIRLVYSKREDKFWACCADANGRISHRNLERFSSVSFSGHRLERGVLLAAAEEAAEKDLRTLVLEFTDEKNRAERLVSEFSPWKKQCTCNSLPDRQTYTMALTYDAQDAFEMAVRLLSYGEGIVIREDTGDVARQIFLRRNAVTQNV